MDFVIFKIRKQSTENRVSFAIMIQKRLSQLKPGQRATIQGFESQELSLKLMEMGCLPGEEVLINQQAPFGDPISLQVAGYTLSLRKEEAQTIFIDTIN